LEAPDKPYRLKGANMTPPEEVYSVSTKTCTKCGINKSFDCFYPVKRGKYGLHSVCKPCMNEKEREYRKLNPRTKHAITTNITEKPCKRCGLVLPITSFYARDAEKDGLDTKCKKCCKAVRDKREIESPGWAVAAYRRYHNKLSPEQKKDISVRSAFQKYETTKEWFDLKLASQNGKCAICGIDKNQKNQRFFMDHDHACHHKKGRACSKCRRDLLCVRCNFRLGAIEDMEWSALAIQYLIKHGKDMSLLHMALTVPSEQPTITP
jgi:hypothetical protein